MINLQETDAKRCFNPKAQQKQTEVLAHRWERVAPWLLQVWGGELRLTRCGASVSSRCRAASVCLHVWKQGAFPLVTWATVPPVPTQRSAVIGQVPVMSSMRVFKIKCLECFKKVSSQTKLNWNNIKETFALTHFGSFSINWTPRRIQSFKLLFWKAGVKHLLWSSSFHLENTKCWLADRCQITISYLINTEPPK